jgi:cystathionine beta-lyase
MTASNPTSKSFSFDQEIDRRVVPALKVHPTVLGQDGADLFPAGVADMDYRAPEVALQAMQQRLDHGVFGYETVPEGLLPALISWFARRHGWKIDEAHLLRAPNVLNILAIATSLFTQEGDAVLVQPPVFFDFFDVLKENHRRVVENPLVLSHGRYHMNYEDLERKAADPKTTMLYLCSPHNPVGRVWTPAELRRLADICLKHGVLVVSDEMHCDLVFPGHPFTSFASLGKPHAANSIVCLSPAKGFNLASCCSAFTVISNEARRTAFRAENSRLTVNKNNAFANVAMRAVYQHGEPWLNAVLEYIQANLQLVRDRLSSIPEVTLIEPDGTFLVWLDFRTLDLEPEALTQFLRQLAGWGVSRGPAFGSQGIGFARVNIACTRARLVNALDHLEQAVRVFSSEVGP